MVIRFNRITTDPNVMEGLPCVRDLGIPVSRILALLAARHDQRAILAAHPGLDPEDIRQAMEYAAHVMARRPAVPANDILQPDVEAAIETILEFRDRHPLGDLSIRELIEEGRRYGS